MLEAYARGVNAWIELKGRFAAPEFLVLGAPEPWAADRQPAVGEDDGTVAVDELAQELSRQALAGQAAARR